MSVTGGILARIEYIFATIDKMPVIVFALISYLGWGTGDIFGTIATRKIGSYSTTFWYLIFQIFLFSFLALFFLADLQNLTLPVLVLNLALGIIGTLGLIAFYEGLRIANASLVGTIAASFAALTVVLSIIFLGETITWPQAVSIIAIFAGVIISSLQFKELRNRNLLTNRGVLLAITTMIMWGIYWAFIKVPVRETGWFWPGFISLSSFPIILIFLKLRNLKLSMPSTKGVFLPLLANAVLLGVGSFSFNFALGKGLTAIVAPIAGSYPTLFVVLAFLVFRDSITRQQIFGIVITLIGIVLLSIFSI